MLITKLQSWKVALYAIFTAGELSSWVAWAQSDLHSARARSATHRQPRGTRHRSLRPVSSRYSGYTSATNLSNASAAETATSFNATSTANASAALESGPQHNLANVAYSSASNFSQSSTRTRPNGSGPEEVQPSAQLSANLSISSAIGNASASSQPSVTTGSLLGAIPSDAMQKNGLLLGFLPDDGSSGGTRQTMAQLNADVGSKSAAYGWYAQAQSGITFDGSQLLAVIDDVKACNCIFQPAVMPIGGWQGLTSADHSQATAIAQVMKKFTDEGIPVWLRFAHEMNYYQTDGTYQGTAADFKAGWAAVSSEIKRIAPDVKMFWSPNVATAKNYASYEPTDMSTVDVVGIDYYPKQLTSTTFIDNMKAFHDKYAVDGRKFAIGETGLGWAGSTADKLSWYNQICEAKDVLPEFLTMAWFNYDKDYDFKIAGEPTLNQNLAALIAG